MKNILIFCILILFGGHLLAQCPGPAQRNALINLQRSLEVEGTRAGQIPLTDTCGNQRYAQYVEVNPDTINYIPTDSGNTQNLSEFVRDTTGTLWYIDWQGNAVSFQGGGGSCDADFLEISDNSCPDALTDSIYKYRYVAVGARYVWPGAEMLVNDSTSSGIVVIQGSRNARLALYDSNAGTFSMIDHGGTTPVWYLPVGANLLWRTTAGTPQTPVGSQVSHFAINTQDSTIQAFQYPNTRTDTQTVANFLYTDGVGKLRSQPIDSIPGLSDISQPNQQIVSGTGTGITSSSDFTHNISGNVVNCADTIWTTRLMRVNVPAGWEYSLTNRVDAGINIQHTQSDPQAVTTANLAYGVWAIGNTTIGTTVTACPNMRFYRAKMSGSNVVQPGAGETIAMLGAGSHTAVNNTLVDVASQVNMALMMTMTADSVAANGTIATGLRFWTKDVGGSSVPTGTQVMHMNKNQNIGIGTNANATNRLFVSGTPRFDLGSDATGDIFYRNSSGNFTRLGIGSSGQVLTVSGGLPSWQPAAGGTCDSCFVTGGNSFGGTATLGTNDNNPLNLETNGVVRASISSGTTTGGALTLTDVTANTNTVEDAVTIRTNSTGTAAANFGPGILFQGESSTTDNRDMARIGAQWTTATDASREAKVSIQLGNNAGALTEIANFNVSGASSGQLSIGSSLPVTITNSAFIPGTSYSIGGTSNLALTSSAASSTGIRIDNSSTSTNGGITIGSSAFGSATNYNRINFSHGYSPSSGSSTFVNINVNGTYNQTGTASGIIRSYFSNPTLTSILGSYRAIELAENNALAKGIYQTGTLTTNNFAGNTGVGSTSDPNTTLDVTGTTSTEHLIGQNLTPTISVGASAGTGASASMVNAQSSDLAGRFSVTTGTTAGPGLWATVTFDDAFTTIPVVIIENEDEDASSTTRYVNVSTTSFELFITSGEANSTTYNFSYHIIGGK